MSIFASPTADTTCDILAAPASGPTSKKHVRPEFSLADLCLPAAFVVAITLVVLAFAEMSEPMRFLCNYFGTATCALLVLAWVISVAIRIQRTRIVTMVDRNRTAIVQMGLDLDRLVAQVANDMALLTATVQKGAAQVSDCLSRQAASLASIEKRLVALEECAARMQEMAERLGALQEIVEDPDAPVLEAFRHGYLLRREHDKQTGGGQVMPFPSRLNGH